MEYGLPLLDMWIKQSNFGAKHLLRPLQVVMNKCMGWIAGGRAYRPYLTANLCGLLSVEKRMDHLRCRFQLHLDLMDPDNPLREILNSLPSKVRKRVAIGHLRNNALYNDFMGQVTDFRIGTLRIQLIDYLAEVKRDIIVARDEDTAPLKAIVEPDARLKGLDADGVLGT